MKNRSGAYDLVVVEAGVAGAAARKDGAHWPSAVGRFGTFSPKSASKALCGLAKADPCTPSSKQAGPSRERLYKLRWHGHRSPS